MGDMRAAPPTGVIAPEMKRQSGAAEPSTAKDAGLLGLPRARVAE